MADWNTNYKLNKFHIALLLSYNTLTSVSCNWNDIYLIEKKKQLLFSMKKIHWTDLEKKSSTISQLFIFYSNSYIIPTNRFLNLRRIVFNNIIIIANTSYTRLSSTFIHSFIKITQSYYSYIRNNNLWVVFFFFFFSFRLMQPFNFTYSNFDWRVACRSEEKSHQLHTYIFNYT